MSDEYRPNIFEAMVDPKWGDFSKAVTDRIGTIGGKRNATGGDARTVQNELFKRTEGDPALVTDEMIEEEFDKLQA